MTQCQSAIYAQHSATVAAAGGGAVSAILDAEDFMCGCPRIISCANWLLTSHIRRGRGVFLFVLCRTKRRGLATLVQVHFSNKPSNCVRLLELKR